MDNSFAVLLATCVLAHRAVLFNARVAATFNCFSVAVSEPLHSLKLGDGLICKVTINEPFIQLEANFLLSIPIDEGPTVAQTQFDRYDHRYVFHRLC